MKNIWILFSILCCVACQQQEDKATDLTREIVITGKVENRDIYPNEKELKLTIPFFSRQAKSYTSAIADDATFTFRFSAHAPLCEVAIRNYAEHLYVRPGDSLHVTIDFKDLLHPQVTGTSAELNKHMTLFTDGGYYRKDYPYDPKAAPEAVKQALKEEYDSRLQRRSDFLKEHSPGKEVEKYTEELLLTDYYVALFGYAYRNSFKNGTPDATHCDKYLAEIDSLLTWDDVVFANRFALVQNVGTFLNIKYHAEHKSTPEPDELLHAVNGKNFRQHLYAYFLGTSLFANDTTYIANRRQKFDSIVTNPYLRQNILSLYKEKADYLNNPRNISDYMLYGHYPGVQPTKNMSFMAPVHQLLAKHKGKWYISAFGECSVARVWPKWNR